jgi:tRNA (cytidine/uridine-2'-O-)-methyltransferase
MFHVALYQPEIPPNTGNIGRQCVGMRAALHLIGPVGFDLAARRSGGRAWIIGTILS